MSWQDREAAPFAQEIWDQIDAVARAAADEVRAARRLVELVGPLGFAARAGVAEDEAVGGDEAGGRGARPRAARAGAPGPAPLLLARRAVHRGARDASASRSCCRRPRRRGDRSGAPRTGSCSPGTRPRGSGGCSRRRDRSSCPAGDWSDPARAADDLLGALARLDAAGRHGPFAVGVSPAASTSSSGRTRGPRSRRTRSSSRRSRAGS